MNASAMAAEITAPAIKVSLASVPLAMTQINISVSQRLRNCNGKFIFFVIGANLF